MFSNMIEEDRIYDEFFFEGLHFDEDDIINDLLEEEEKEA